MIELWQGDVDCVVFLQTIEHIQDPDAMLDHIKELIEPGGVAYVSTPNVLTLAPKGQVRSGNPWHVREYRPDEYRELCERHFATSTCSGCSTRASCALTRSRSNASAGTTSTRACGSRSRSTTVSRPRSAPATSRSDAPTSTQPRPARRPPP